MRGLSAQERRLALRTIGLMAGVRIALWIAPFRWIRKRAELAGGSASGTVDGITAKQVAWAVRLASRYIPAASCLTQALTAQWLLNRAGIENQIHIGVALGNGREATGRGGFEAHAWVQHDGAVLVGGADESSRYSPILTIGKPPVGK
jgi:hypothetical protein